MSASRIAIVGGGPVGLALACACRGCDVRIVEASAARDVPSTEQYDIRVYALSAGTRAFLRDIGAWEHLDARRIAAVRRMDVYGDAGAKLSFAGRTASALAWIVEAGQLNRALETQAASAANIVMTRGAQATGFGAQADSAWMQLDTGERIEADLLVGADGPDSRVRTLLGLPAQEHPYEESAIVANFEVEREHADTARQWFRADGVLAWLPLPGKRISIVWSARGALAGELAALPQPDFERRVRDAGGAALGELRLVSAVAKFPLRMIQVERLVAPGVALIGDAAHTVHPLAGQGVNLGFQDARVLAEELAARSALERPGDLRVLRRYARGRREDVTSMQFVTDRLDRLFADDRPGVAAFRNLGLRLVESAPLIKDVLATRAMR
jgi:ubiquinone biosynthesis UbiH/UbiF/VisC/COQ6 family hydroxylase